MNYRIRFPWRLFSRIVALQTISVLLALGISGIAARSFFKRQFIAQIEEQVRISLGSLARDLPAQVSDSWCSEHSSDASFQLTVVTIDGKLLCDSQLKSYAKESHLEHPEVLAAINDGFGQNVRFSSNQNEEILYGAFLLRSREVVLRGALPLAKLNRTLRVLDTSLALLLFSMALALIGFAVWSGRSLAFPIGRLLHKAQRVAAHSENPEASVSGENDTMREEPFGELSELESSLDDIGRELELKAESLSRERDEQATLMGAISDAILAVDSDGAPLFFNSRFAVLFGGTAALQGEKARLWEIFRDPEILEAFRATLKDGTRRLVNTIEIEQQTGLNFYSLSVSPLRRSTAGYEVYGAVGIFHDVSELKRAEQIRIDFVANVSHELRTPLTAIKGYTDTLTEDLKLGRPASPEFVEVIQRNTERLMSLINDLLDLSSLESNVDELQRTLVETKEISERVMRQLHGAIEAKGQRVSLEANAVAVYADPRRLEQVIVNLVDNASKYTPRGGSIKLRWQTDPAGKNTLLKVIDTGPGIPTEHHARLFERFYRVDKARSRELGGTGLGLAIVKHILQRHGGNVRVESAVGQGSTFICEFPVG